MGLDGAKKSFYIFLCSLLGMLLFLILHRIVFILYFFLLDINFSVYSFGMNFMQITAIDYLTLLLALFGGWWYGVWLGMYWYEAVYEQGDRHGFVGHLVSRYWPTKPSAYNLRDKIHTVAEKLEDDLEDLEALAVSVEKKTVRRPLADKPMAAKRRIVRRKTAVKNNS